MRRKKNITLNHTTTDIVYEDFNKIRQKYDVSEYIECERLDKARSKVLLSNHSYKGFGTLAEKTVHGIFKNFYEPDEDNHEVALDGYFADIYNDCGVIEIQNGNFNKLRDKLMIFLNNYHVTIVYPVLCNKHLSWIEKDSMTIVERRKSPIHFTEYDAFYELYKIKDMLSHPNISLQLVLMDVEEYRMFSGYGSRGKKNSKRYDRIPVGIRNIINIDCIEDYMQFIPFALEDGFTSADFAANAHITGKTAGIVLNVLNSIGMVQRTGKKKNMYIYSVNGD